MRSSKNRSRSKSNRQRSIGNIINRVFDSSGPESKVRGTPQQIIDKYLQLARDAQLSNDRVAEQNFLQHAEHYTRMLGEAQAELAREQAARQGQQGNGQQGGNLQGGQHGGGQQHGQPQQAQNRDRGDYRAPRDDDDAPPAIAAFHDTGEQPEIEEVGIVETPEMHGGRRDDNRRDQPRRDRREDRPQGERRNDQRGEQRSAEPDPVVPEAASPAAPQEGAPASGDAEKPARRAPRSRSRAPRDEVATDPSDPSADAAE